MFKIVALISKYLTQKNINYIFRKGLKTQIDSAEKSEKGPTPNKEARKVNEHKWIRDKLKTNAGRRLSICDKRTKIRRISYERDVSYRL